MKRLFVALRLPEEALPAVTEAQEALKEAVPGAKWVDPRGAHMTLKFLGPTPEESLSDIIAALKEAIQDVSAYAYAVRGIGGFPTSTRPRVIWAGIDDNGQSAELAKPIELAMTRLGFQPEERDFHPHITLARIKNPHRLDKPEILIDAGRSLCVEGLEASEIALIASRLTPNGAIYTVVSLAALKERDKTS